MTEKRIRYFNRRNRKIFNILTSFVKYVILNQLKFYENGRVNPIVAKICGVLGLRVVGKAGDKGTLEVTGKARGEKNALAHIFSDMKKNGYKGKKVRIHHATNENAAVSLKDLIRSEYPEADILICKTRGLCSFYAELGGLLVGYEG